jgi:predicted O-methyltransferase YrrM
MSENEYYFVNGLIRLFRPKKLLEIGVCSGGMSAAILNSIKDIKGAMLYSCDLEKNIIKV